MAEAQRPWIAAERAITRELEGFQRRAAATWQGMEKEGLIALVRTLDGVSIATRLPDVDGCRAALDDDDRVFVLMGATTALRPFLAAVKGLPGGVPWGPMSANHAAFARSYLGCCGALAHLRRMASLERYGLARTSTTPGGLVIEVQSSAPELAHQFALRALRSSLPRDPLPGGESVDRHWRRVHRRMRSYVDSVDGWFIRYDNDMRIVSAYRTEASDYGLHFLEREALPPDVHVGDRTFAEWRIACDQALGRILCHIDFSGQLCRKRHGIETRNVFTIFARREDVAAVWREAGLAPERVDSTVAALTLSIDGLDEWELAHEMPCPYYVDLGRDFVLLPCFGALTNPYFALFRHLRSVHRSDWDRGVDLRESVFREDLAKAFPQPRFTVLPRGHKLRRSDGSTLTDVDAVVLDRTSGSLALVQLKWHDVFGYSLSERESRRRNLLQANEWIERVTRWIDGRSSAAVAEELGLPGSGTSAPPVLYVLARYAARFSGEGKQDPRAAWVGWYEVLHALASGECIDPIIDIPRLIAEHQARFDGPRDFQHEFRFPGLSVELRSPP